jgi:polysaccharide export outer membrane protein
MPPPTPGWHACPSLAILGAFSSAVRPLSPTAEKLPVTLPPSRLPRRRLGAIALLLPAATLGACAQPGAGLPPLTDAERGEYRLGGGDTLRVLVFGDPRLNGEFRVSDDGGVALPLIGQVPAAGRTTRELERTVATQLQSQGVLRNPQVAIEVLNYRPFFILGEVERPGQYAFQPGMTVLTAVAIGGGFTYRANRDFASITRAVEGTPTEGRVGRASLVQPGDVITVFERRF